MNLRSRGPSVKPHKGDGNPVKKQTHKRRSVGNPEEMKPKRITRSSTSGKVLGDITNRHANRQTRSKRPKQEKVGNQLNTQCSQGAKHASQQNRLPDSSTHTGINNSIIQKAPFPIPNSVFDILDSAGDDVDAMRDESSSEEEKVQETSLLTIDAADIHNPQAVSEYIQDIMIYFRGVESERAPRADYINLQQNITKKMREILIDWLNEVHLKFKLRLETMYLTVNLIDRFLSINNQVVKEELQLVGCTAMLIASKYEEIYSPEVRDFVYISDRAYTREQILNMECGMLNTLKFNLTVPSALRFGQRFIKLVPNADERFKQLVKYLMELTLQSYHFLTYLPSKIAASATYLALSMMSEEPGTPEWPSLLQIQTNYDEERLKNCVRDLQQLAARSPHKYRAVRKKYSSRKFLQVATIPVGRPLFNHP